MATRASTVHRLKVTLRQVKPPIWRRIEVRSDIKLSDLSDLLEVAMGWCGGHLHSFEADGVAYELPDPDWLGFGPRPVDERKARLGAVLPKVGSKMRWDYDFGDGWEHDVLVEAIEPARSDATYPVCLAGKRACPPDDCGGPWGYGNLLAVLADPKHPEHGEMVEWVTPDFDPEAFDAAETTGDMREDRLRQEW